MGKHRLMGAQAAILITAWYCTPVVAALACGPGSGWVTTCSAGTQTLHVTMNYGIDTDFDSLGDVDVSFVGNMVVHRSAPYASDPISAPDHLDRIDTEILSMSLTGATSYVEGWGFRMGVNEGIAPSLGYIQEQPDPTVALSRYDTVFEIDSIPHGSLTHNLNDSVFFEVLVSGLPEIGAKYNHTGAPFGTTIPLFDSAGNEVLRLTDQIETDFVTEGRPHFIVDSVVVPLPSAFWLFGSGLLTLAGWLGHKKTISS